MGWLSRGCKSAEMVPPVAVLKVLEVEGDVPTYLKKGKNWQVKMLLGSKGNHAGEVVTFPVKRRWGYTWGFILHYRRGGEDNWLGVSDQYVPTLEGGKWTAGAVDGCVRAVPMFGMPDDAPGDDFKMLLKTHAHSETHRTLNGGGGIPWKVVLVVVGVAIVGYFGWEAFKPKSVPVALPTTTAVGVVEPRVVPGGVSPVIIDSSGTDGPRR